MPTIKIPSNVILTDMNGTPVKSENGALVEIDFVKSFLGNTVLNDPKWGKSTQWLFAAMDLNDMFKNASPGSEVVISQDVWDKLREVVAEPSSPYNVSVMRQARSFITCILSPEKA